MQRGISSNRKSSFHKRGLEVKLIVLFVVVVDFENSDWFAWLYPSHYTAAYRFGIAMMALGAYLCGFM